jgi:methenyltetrahydromethanopterin cyclohydrolase
MAYMNLNQLAWERCEQFLAASTQHHVALLRDETGVRIVDCGVHVSGGLAAGIALAEICLAGLGRVAMVPGDSSLCPGPAITVATDDPVAACLASQYAGWQIAGKSYFAMGSGSMRAVRGKEPVFDVIGHREQADRVVGALEASRLPQDDVCQLVAQECRVDPEYLTLLVAPTNTLAGTIQVVARSLETALHKMHEIGFNIASVLSGFGSAPLPPVAADNIEAIGRTNDAVLYGGEVTLWVRCSDDELTEYGPRIPSAASPDHGQPFIEIFERYDRDFYKIDPMLFSPAVVTLNNLETGSSFRYGKSSPQLLLRAHKN